MLCPYCDHQGMIVKAKLKVDDSIVFMCDECDTIWRESENISETTGKSSFLVAEELSVSLQTLFRELEFLR